MISASKVRGVVLALSVTFLFILVSVGLALSFVGERHWVTAFALYLPPQGYLLAWLGLSVLVVLGRSLLVAVLHSVSLCFILWFMMGLHLNFHRSVPHSLVVLSLNVDSAHAGVREVVDAITVEQPDIIFLQETAWRGEELAERLRLLYPHVLVEWQFVMASRFPLRDVVVPEPFFFWNRLRTPQFLRVVVDTPSGPVATYNLHPVSPRHAFYAVRGQGFRHEIRTGQLFRQGTSAVVEKNFGQRERELAAASQMIGKESGPVLVAGDLNVPQMSRLVARFFPGFGDAFADAGWGFGYTYPRKFPFLRLDRILGSSGVRFLNARAGCVGVSDHLCIISELTFVSSD